MVPWTSLLVAGFLGVLAGVVAMLILRMEVPMGEVITVDSEQVGPRTVLLERNQSGWRVSEERYGLYIILETALPEGLARVTFAKRVAELRELAAALESAGVEG